MASTDQIRQRQLELEQERLLQEQQRLQYQQEQELRREQELRENEPQIVATEFTDQLQQRMLDAIWAGLTGVIALVMTTGDQMRKAAGGWMSDRFEEGMTALETNIQNYLKANPNPPAQTLEQMAKQLGTLEQEMRKRDISGASQVAALRQYVLDQRDRVRIDVQPRPELDPNAINVPSSDQQVARPGHTGHSRQETFDPNVINQPGSIQPPQAPKHTVHRPEAEEQPAVTDVFSSANDGTTRANAADILAKNMVAANQELLRNGELPEPGWTPQPGYAAHHIAPYQGTWNDSRRQLSEDIQTEMDRLNIGLNEAVNGVFLPHNKEVRIDSQNGGASYHPRVHKKEILQDLLDGLKGANNKQEGIKVLDQIRDRLLSNYYELSELQQRDEVEVAQQPQPTPTEQPQTRTFSPEFYDKWNALLAQGQQDCAALNALRQQQRASLAEHANIMNDHSTTFAGSLSELQATQATAAQAWNSLEPAQYSPFKTSEELKAEVMRETYEAEHGFDNLVATRNAPVLAAGLERSLELSRRPNTDG